THTTSPSFTQPPPGSTPIPYTTLFRSQERRPAEEEEVLYADQIEEQERQQGDHRQIDRAGQRDTGQHVIDVLRRPGTRLHPGDEDRKSTRLNSSHVKSSYAVFCLKKKT